MATIRDVAEMAGVSTATVSHVMNETRFVSQGLRDRVLRAMDELEYCPNLLAQGLRKGQSKTIGLVVPDNSNPFFAEVARCVEDIGFDNGYSVILCNSDGEVRKESAYIDVLIAKQVDGVVFIAAGSEPDHLDRLADHGTPIVVADRDVGQGCVDLVLVDNENGGYIAAQHLIGLGHERIAAIAGPSSVTPSATRLDGYRRALREAGISIDTGLVVQGDFRLEGGERAARQLLDRDRLPSAMFACNDLMAIGAMRAVRKAGLQVPDDVSIVGFDGIQLGSAVSPTLTTVVQPIECLATTAADILMKRIEVGSVREAVQRVVLEPELLVRESTCTPLDAARR